MDERLKQIKEGAGLDESRINQEFVDAIKKYSTPVLVVIAVLAGGYFFYHKRQRDRAASIDAAMVQFDSAFASRSPATLRAVADDAPSYSGAKVLALLSLGDLHLEAFRTGVPSGADLDADGNIRTEGLAFLTPDERTQQLREAERAFQRAADLVQSDPSRRLALLQALGGLAAVDESRGEIDAAKARYGRMAQIAESHGLTPLAKTLRGLAESSEALKSAPRLYAANELASATAPAVPFSTGLQNIQFRDAQGNPISPPGIEAVPIGDPQPVPSPAPEPTPAETPGAEPTSEPEANP
ncbi:MAG: hypothetical protein KF768_10040 [Phycisphaeraceae bacterium]|nr:hypothetical protein [Phycisphaeraceae bacterium]